MLVTCRKNLHLKLESFHSIPEVVEGFVAILNVKLAVFSTSQTFEIGTKASAALAD